MSLYRWCARSCVRSPGAFGRRSDRRRPDVTHAPKTDRAHLGASAGKPSVDPYLCCGRGGDSALLQRARGGDAGAPLRRGRRDAVGRVVHHVPADGRKRRPHPPGRAPARHRGARAAAGASSHRHHRARWCAEDDRGHGLPPGGPGRTAPRRGGHVLENGQLVRVTLWGTRGSLPSPGPGTLRYGGNTPCVEVRGEAGTLLVLDAGTGIRPLGSSMKTGAARVDILLTHFHMDHILGLGFFAPLERPDLEIHIWGPAAAPLDLQSRLIRYLSPPFFPVRLSDLPSRLVFHDTPLGPFAIGEFEITAALVCHPGLTLGYRIADRSGVMSYIPDHEPALGVRRFPQEADWTSGFDLACCADLLIHDAQYTD